MRLLVAFVVSLLMAPMPAAGQSGSKMLRIGALGGATASIVAFAAQERLSAIYALSDLVRTGGLMAYGPDRADMYHRAGAYVGLILKGARLADLQVAQPTKFELVINLKTANALGVTIPASVLARADEVMKS